MRPRGVWFRWASLACVLAAPAAAHAGVSFTSSPYPLPVADTEYHSRIGAVAIVDLNTDNHPDIVVYRGGGNIGQLYVLLNQGAGTFAAAETYDVCANPDGGTMVTGQFDAGSAPDVILGCEAGTGHDELLGNGDGTLGASTHTTGPELNNVLALWPGDDGALPILLFGVYNSVPPPVVALCHKAVNDLGASGGFGTCLPDTSSTDSNGDPDGHASIGPALATAHLYDNTACPRDDVIFSPYLRSVRSWGLNPFGRDGGIIACDSFAYTERNLALPEDVVLAGISTADLSGDGSPDLLMNGGPQFNSDRLVALIWQNNVADMGGGFPPGQQPVVTPSIPGIEDQHVADFDGDGIADAAVVGEAPAAPTATLAIQRGHGDGSFDTPPVTFPVPGASPDGFNTTGPNRLAAADLNGDGKPDLVSVAQLDGSVTVLLNGSTPPPPTTTPPPSTTPPALDTTVPVITGLTLARRTFRVGRAATAVAAAVARGTTVRYTLSEAAKVTIAVARKAAGRRKGRKCVAPTSELRHAKRCTRYRSEGRLVRAGRPGAASIPFSGRIGKRALAVGVHRMTLSATDPSGNASKGSRLSFRIVRG